MTGGRAHFNHVFGVPAALRLQSLAGPLAAIGLALAAAPGVAAPLIETSTSTAAAPLAAPAPALDGVAERLRALVERDAASEAGRAPDGTGEAAAVQRFYAARGYQPVWLGDEARVAALAAALGQAGEHGLDYAIPAGALPGADRKRALPAAERELLLTRLAISYATALAAGQTRPDRFETDWAIAPPVFDAAPGLARALAAGDIGGWFAKLAPHHAAYERLRGALAKYRALAKAGGWEPVARGQPLKLGMADERVKALRKRLAVEGDLPADTPAAPPAPAAPVASAPAAAGPIVKASATIADQPPAAPATAPLDPATVFDATVEAGVKHFQARNGIAVDGAAGPRTLAAMNVPVRARIAQIELNLERWRSLPHELGASYMLVNVPGETLDVIEDGAPVMSMKVVVGDPGHPTPVVRATMAAVTFNPAWTIPSSIIKNEITPKLKLDRDYLGKNEMMYVPGKGLQQLPGPKNPLGRIKFETPNRFDVYLHDTPSRTAFDRYFRAQSHGCIRVERAHELATLVLQSNQWSSDQIEAAVASGETQRVDLKRRWRVYVFYETAFADPDGAVEFRDDLYGRDKRLKAALAGEFPVKAAEGAPEPKRQVRAAM